MSNNDLMYFLLKNSNLKDLQYSDNKLTYQGKTIDISNIYISDFMKSTYSPLALNQQIITAEDLFNIFELHTKKISKESDKKDINNLAQMALNKLSNVKEEKIISPKEYFEILEKQEISDEEYKKIEEFEIEVSQCMKYSDYLLDDKKDFVTDYNNRINNIIYALQENPTQKLTNRQEYSIKKYDGMLEDAKNFTNQKEKQRQKKLEKTNPNNNVSLGYANSFIVILSTIAAGIITAITIYLSIK